MIEIINTPVDSNVIDDWKNDLVDALNTLKVQEAQTFKAQTTLDNATQWETKLRAWLDSLEQTVDLTDQLEEELVLFDAQLSTVSVSTQCVVQAIDILFREVKKVFLDSALKDSSQCFPCDVESLGLKIREWQNEVNCLGNVPNLNKGGGFLKKLTELEAKLKVVEDLRDGILKKMIALVQAANQMSSVITNGDGATDEDDGLRGIIQTMQKEFAGGSTKEEASNFPKALRMPRHCGCHSTDDTAHSCCSELTPIICFPLSGDPFVVEMGDCLKLATEEKGKAAEKYNVSRKDRDRILARKNGLEKALLAVDVAKK